MAALNGIIAQTGIATGTALKTILQLAAGTNQRVRIKEIAISFHGTVNTNEPILVQLRRQSTAGTMTGLTPKPTDEDVPTTFRSTGQHTATVEPTDVSNAGFAMAVHPQSGIVYQFARGDEIIIKAGGFLGLVTTAPAGVNCDAHIRFEE